MKLDQLFGTRGSKLCGKVLSLKERIPNWFPTSIVKELAAFLSNCSDRFLDERELQILCRILFSQHRLFSQAKESPAQKIYVRIIQLNPSIYGVAMALSSLGDREIFNERHIHKGIQSLIPGIKAVANSYYFRKQDQIHHFYLEIKKIRGGFFSQAERHKLEFELHSRLIQGIERISQSLYLPGNEEELFKNIHRLSHEVKYVNDLPQAMITFVEYFQETLKFLVIVVRVMKPSTPSILSLSLQLPSAVHFSLEHVVNAENLRKKYPKEAAVFTLEISSTSFLRNQNAVNLRAARQYIVKILEAILGPFRDYNGGLLYQENEQLLKIKDAYAKKGVFLPYLDDLFYGIKPISMRAVLSLETGIELISLFQKISAIPLEKEQKYHLEFQSTQESQLIMIKTREIEWKTSFLERVLSLSSKIGCSSFEENGYLYLCFFQESSQGDLLHKIQHELLECQLLFSDQKRAILRINFQGGDPPSLNPRLATDLPCHILSNFLFEGLTRLNRSGVVEPAAAERIEVSSCKTRYTFYLRPAWWSNGEELTAYHFERTWKRTIMASPAGSIYPDFFFTIKNAKRAREKTALLDQVKIRAKNSKTLSVELDYPCPYFLNLLSTPPFFPLFGETEEPTVFNGPFILTEWKRDYLLNLSRNPFYWNSRQSKIGGLKIFMVRDPNLAYEMFKLGELDIIGDPTSPLTPGMLKSPEIQKNLLFKQISRIFWIHCNQKKTPLSNAHLRRALSLSINRNKLIERVFVEQIPHASPLPPKYSQARGNLEGDFDQARELFNKALFELKIHRSAFPEIVMTHSDLSFEKPLFEELKAQWKDTLGITIISRQLQWSEFSSALERGDFQLGGMFRRDLYNNPMFYLRFFKSTPHNFHSFENKKYEQLLKQLHRTKDTEEIIKNIEHMLIEKAPVIPLVNQRCAILVNDRIKGVNLIENGCIDLKEVSIK